MGSLGPGGLCLYAGIITGVLFALFLLIDRVTTLSRRKKLEESWGAFADDNGLELRGMSNQITGISVEGQYRDYRVKLYYQDEPEVPFKVYTILNLSFKSKIPAKLEIIWKSKFMRLAALLGYRGIRLNDEGFDRYFHVKCKDPSLPHLVLNYAIRCKMITMARCRFTWDNHFGGRALCNHNGLISDAGMLTSMLEILGDVALELAKYSNRLPD